MTRSFWLALAALAAGTAAAHAETFTGELGGGDAVRDSGEYIDTFHFTAQAGQEVTVSMTSADFDTYLIVRSPSGMELTNDDFDTDRSQLSLITDRAGEWTIEASSYSSGEGGPYTVDVTVGRTGRVATTEGRLDFRDERGMKGEYFDLHLIELPPGGEYYIELLSLGFDGYLSVLSPTNEASRNDDTGGTTLARVGPLRGAPGQWKVFVTTVSEGEVGAYDLNIVAFDGPAAAGVRSPAVEPPAPPAPIPPSGPRPVGAPPG